MKRAYIFAVILAAAVNSFADYCRTAKTDGRWTYLDGEGREFFASGVGHVPRTVENAAKLRAWGFNTSEASDDGSMFLTPFIGFDGICYQADEDGYIRKANGGPMTAMPNPFSPLFPEWCEKRAAEFCAPRQDATNIIGYYLDNELAWWGKQGYLLDEGLFDYVKTFPETHSARRALERFVGGREVTREVKLAFLELAAEKYFSITTAAVRRHDPNHLILGCRFAGPNGADETVYRVAGRYCDVISLNIYPVADLARGDLYILRGRERLADWLTRLSKVAGKPITISEWSFPAMDTGRLCRRGAGQRVPTQTERVKCCELFMRTILSLPCVVGQDFFTWMDQPIEGQAGANPEDCNYGVVREDGTPYEELTQMFTRVNGAIPELRRAKTPKAKSESFASEREAFLKVHAKDKGKVEFTREGENWKLVNKTGLELRGRIANCPLVESVMLGGRRFGACNSTVGRDMPCEWYGVVAVTDVAFEEKGGCGAVVLTGRTGGVTGATGDDSASVAFEVTARFTMAGEGQDFLFEIVSVKNTGAKRVEVCSVFASPRPADDTFEPYKKPVKNWSEPVAAAWQSSDGRLFAARSREAALAGMNLVRDANRWPHCDVFFAPEKRAYLEPGETFLPDRPMAVQMKVR